MKRFIPVFAAVLALTLTAGPSAAEEPTKAPEEVAKETPAPGTTPPADAAPSGQPAATPPSADPVAVPDAVPEAEGAAATPATDVVGRIRAEGAKLEPKAKDKFEAAIAPHLNDVEKSASSDGDQRIAERLGGEFGMTADALLAEKSELGASWGQLMIAHSLLANTTSDVTARQLFDLRKEGMSWGQIASGMGFTLGEVVRAAQAESKVAKGLVKADGKAHEIHGSASKAGAHAKPQKAAKSANAAKPDAGSAKTDAGGAQAEPAAKVEGGSAKGAGKK